MNQSVLSGIMYSRYKSSFVFTTYRKLLKVKGIWLIRLPHWFSGIHNRLYLFNKIVLSQKVSIAQLFETPGLKFANPSVQSSFLICEILKLI
jgi:hypothetical protein